MLFVVLLKSYRKFAATDHISIFCYHQWRLNLVWSLEYWAWASNWTQFIKRAWVKLLLKRVNKILFFYNLDKNKEKMIKNGYLIWYIKPTPKAWAELEPNPNSWVTSLSRSNQPPDHVNWKQHIQGILISTSLWCCTGCLSPLFFPTIPFDWSYSFVFWGIGYKKVFRCRKREKRTLLASLNERLVHWRWGTDISALMSVPQRSMDQTFVKGRWTQSLLKKERTN